MSSQEPPQSRWATRRAEKHRRLARVTAIADGVAVPTDRLVDVLRTLIAPGDRVVVEGNNQKQAAEGLRERPRCASDATPAFGRYLRR